MLSVVSVIKLKQNRFQVNLIVNHNLLHVYVGSILDYKLSLIRFI